MKYCKRCGSKLRDDARFCGTCGQPVSSTEQRQERGYEQQFQSQGTADYGAKRTVLLPVILLAAAVVAVIAAFFMFRTPEYEKPVKYMIKAMNEENTEYLYQCFPFDAIEGASADDFSIIRRSFYGVLDEMTDGYGEEYKVSYKILDKEKLSSKRIAELQASYDNMGMGDFAVGKGYELTVRVTVKGKKGSESQTVSLNSVKINGKWSLDFLNSQIF